MTTDKEAEQRLTMAGLERVMRGLHKIEEGRADIQTGMRMVQFANADAEDLQRNWLPDTPDEPIE